MKQTQEIVDQLLAAGHKAEVKGNWVQWSPPPPTKLMMRLITCDQTKVVAAIRNREK